MVKRFNGTVIHRKGINRLNKTSVLEYYPNISIPKKVSKFVTRIREEHDDMAIVSLENNQVILTLFEGDEYRNICVPNFITSVVYHPVKDVPMIPLMQINDKEGIWLSTKYPKSFLNDVSKVLVTNLTELMEVNV